MIYQISNEQIRVSVSDIGAEMTSIQSGGAEYLWNGDARYWDEQAPVLFPYVGRFTEGKYTLDGKLYEMNIHGFAGKMPFRAALQEPHRIVFQMSDTKETYASYPFRFLLEIEYVLSEHTIGITYRVTNRTDQTMYFGIGGHPGFCVPLEEKLCFSDYYLEFGGRCCPQRVGHTSACFLSGINTCFPLEDGGRTLPLSHGLFDDDAIVLKDMADEVTLKSDKGTRQVKVSYPHFPYLGIWHAPKTEAPYVCIEPWTSLPSRQDIIEEFRCKSDLLRLPSHGQYFNEWKITIL